jgi:hypothetical protein
MICLMIARRRTSSGEQEKPRSVASSPSAIASR